MYVEPSEYTFFQSHPLFTEKVGTKRDKTLLIQILNFKTKKYRYVLIHISCKMLTGHIYIVLVAQYWKPFPESVVCLSYQFVFYGTSFQPGYMSVTRGWPISHPHFG